MSHRNTTDVFTIIVVNWWTIFDLLDSHTCNFENCSVAKLIPQNTGSVVLDLRALDHRNYEMLWECPVSKPSKHTFCYLKKIIQLLKVG